MVSAASNYIPYSYLYNASLGSGRVTVPVSPAQLPYAFFKNVSGTVSGSGSVYSLDKLKILDTLIDRLRSAKGEKALLPASELRDADESRLDALIQNYGRELHAAVVADSLPYAKPAGVSPGMLVSVAA